MSSIDLISIGLGNFLRELIESETPNRRPSWSQYGRLDLLGGHTQTLVLGPIEVKYNTEYHAGVKTDFIIVISTNYRD